MRKFTERYRFFSGDPTFFSTQLFHTSTSPTNISLQKMCFSYGTLSLKSSKSFHTDIIQERAAGYGETPRTRIPGAPPTHHAHPRTPHTDATRTAHTDAAGL